MTELEKLNEELEINKKKTDVLFLKNEKLKRKIRSLLMGDERQFDDLCKNLIKQQWGGIKNNLKIHWQITPYEDFRIVAASDDAYTRLYKIDTKDLNCSLIRTVSHFDIRRSGFEAACKQHRVGSYRPAYLHESFESLTKLCEAITNREDLPPSETPTITNNSEERIVSFTTNGYDDEKIQITLKVLVCDLTGKAYVYDTKTN